jgi:hypothetical protein
MQFLGVITAVCSSVGRKVEDDRFPVLRNHNIIHLTAMRVGITFSWGEQYLHLFTDGLYQDNSREVSSFQSFYEK